ncbi:MAG: LacI family DNA-binding transcriptional regulator [Candidatus Dormiibacterota bacterium]
MQRIPERERPRGAPTVRDVALAAGVSVATVSRVLNANAGVDPGRRQRVLDVIAELGYRRDGVARNLRRRSTRVIGVVITDIENPFFTRLIRGVQDQAESEGYSIVLLNSDEDPLKEARCIDVLAEERVAGVLLTSVSEVTTSVDALIAGHTPIVLIDRRVPRTDLDLVIVDNVRGARLGTEHLLAEGYRRIACVTGPAHSTTGNERRLGYEAALLAAGLTPDPALIWHTDFRSEGGHAAARALLRMARRPDAMIVMNNLMTEGALRAIHEAGVRMPDELGLVGFDDLTWQQLVDPPVTTIAQPVREIGINATELLLRRCRGDRQPPATILLEPTLLRRGSSQRPR